MLFTQMDAKVFIGGRGTKRGVIAGGGFSFPPSTHGRRNIISVTKKWKN